MRVNREIVTVIKIGNNLYKSPYPAARAFADDVAYQINYRYTTRLEKIYDDDDPFWETFDDSLVYDNAYEKAYRRSLPIFKRFFEEA